MFRLKQMSIQAAAQRSPGTHSRRCVICGRDSNRRRLVFLSFYRTIGDSDDGEVWEFRGGFGVHVCSKCRLMQNVKALLVFGLCLSLCLALLRLVYVISTKTEWHPLWYFCLGVLAVGIPLILCLNYDMFVAAARFAKLGKSTDPRFSILQAHGYAISVDFHLRDVRDQDDVQGGVVSTKRLIRKDLRMMSNGGLVLFATVSTMNGLCIRYMNGWATSTWQVTRGFSRLDWRRRNAW